MERNSEKPLGNCSSEASSSGASFGNAALAAMLTEILPVGVALRFQESENDFQVKGYLYGAMFLNGQCSFRSNTWAKVG